ncbi:MAG: hypothetical protein ACP5U2_17385, partial [Bryobacteraceae bacterium]
MVNDLVWKTKVAARLHDPAEKALVLLRDPAGHEGGTSAALARLAGLFEIRGDTIPRDAEKPLAAVAFREGIPREIYRFVQRADWWAAAADRPQWPLQEITVPTAGGETATRAVAPWARVGWDAQPVLIHPLGGAQHTLPGGLTETDLEDIKRRSFEHFGRLLEVCGVRG